MTDKLAMTIGTIAAVGIGLAAIVLIWRLGRRKLTVIPLVVTVLAFTTASVLFWYTHRPLPNNLSGQLFTGIHYSREIIDGPIIVYTVRIDLHAPGIGFMVTPARTNNKLLPFAHEQPPNFLQEFGVQLAINADLLRSLA